MARIRTIKPEFPQSESMGRVSRDARLLFIQIWTLCDDAGRARASSRMLASLLYPYDDDAPGLISGWLDELAREGCITLYEADNKHFLEVKNWQDHQRIDRPSASKFPNPREDSRAFDEGSALDQGRDQGREREGKAREEPRAKPAPPPLNGHATNIPDDWEPTPDDRAWAKIAKPDLDAADLRRETQAFILHAAETRRTTFDRGASWRRWIMKASHANPAGRPKPASSLGSVPG